MQGVHIIPYWNRREQLQFSIVFDTYFNDKDSAIKYLAKFSSFIGEEGNIIGEWDPDTVFFSKVNLWAIAKGSEH